MYKNHKITVMGDVALAMGTYDFTCATTGDVSTVEYTFGYGALRGRRVRIFLHHSSVPHAADRRRALRGERTRRDAPPGAF